jgi:hypothetical protein
MFLSRRIKGLSFSGSYRTLVMGSQSRTLAVDEMSMRQ